MIKTKIGTRYFNNRLSGVLKLFTQSRKENRKVILSQVSSPASGTIRINSLSKHIVPEAGDDVGSQKLCIYGLGKEFQLSSCASSVNYNWLFNNSFSVFVDMTQQSKLGFCYFIMSSFDCALILSEYFSEFNDKELGRIKFTTPIHAVLLIF